MFQTAGVNPRHEKKVGRCIGRVNDYCWPENEPYLKRRSGFDVC